MPSLSPDSKWGYFGPNKEYDFTPAGKILTEKKWFREEFVNAGLPKKTIDYAYTNRAEFIAVAVTGDMTKYSPKFKKVLIELGTPE